MLKDTYLNKILRYRGIPCRGGTFGVIGGFLFGYYVTGFLYRKVLSFFGKSVR